MTSPVSHGGASRVPVYVGGRRVPNLYERTRADGSTVYEFGGRLDGTFHRITLVALTKTDAAAEVQALQVDYRRGEPYLSPAAGVTVAELSADWLEHLATRVGDRDPRRRYSARTVKLYRQRMTQHVVPVLGRRLVVELTVADIRRFVDELCATGLAPSTVTGIINNVSAMSRFGIKQAVVDRNVVRDLDRDDRPGVKRLSEPRYITIEQANTVMGNLGDTFRPVIAMCVLAATSISEALGRSWYEADFKAGDLAIDLQLGDEDDLVPAKTPARVAIVPMVPALVRELLAHRARLASRDLRLVKPDALIFTTSRGKPQSRRNALRALKTAGDKAGLNGEGVEPLGLHDLRHSFVAAGLAGGASLPEMAKLARHANADVTGRIYAGLVEGGERAASEKMVAYGWGA